MNWIAIAFCSLTVAGCVGSVLETTPPKPRYFIGGVDADETTGPSVSWSLIVSEPSAPGAYDTTKVAVSPRPGRLEFLADGEWAGRAPRVFQTALIESFEDSGRILAVGDADAIPLSDYRLETTIRRLDLDAAGNPQARVDIYAKLFSRRGGVIASKQFEAAAPARSTKGDDVADAFEQSFASVLTDLVNWTFEEGRAAHSVDS